MALITLVDTVDVMVPFTEMVDCAIFVLVRVWTVVLGSVVVFVTHINVFAVTVLGVGWIIVIGVTVATQPTVWRMAIGRMRVSIFNLRVVAGGQAASAIYIEHL